MGKALGWIDSHCHLTCADLIGDAWDVRQRALDAGVARMMIVCCRLEEAEAALKMKAEDARFDVAVGFHPSDLRDFTEEDWHKLETLVYNENVTAIGEIGLDYYWDKDNHPQQQAAFIRQIELANRVNKPILVHSRDAIGDTLALLREHPAARPGNSSSLATRSAWADRSRSKMPKPRKRWRRTWTWRICRLKPIVLI